MRKRTSDAAKINLQEAIALLLHNQAQFVSQQAQFVNQFAESQRRFANIERKLDLIERILYDLPEAVRQKIGFKPQ